MKNHPAGLKLLFSTEMWERFNFYGMRALLTLFLVNALSYQESDAAILYGGFLGLSYLTPMFGGYISDRYLGNRISILIGGSAMAIGQLFLFGSAASFGNDQSLSNIFLWSGLFTLVIGNGFFKPNISSMVGQLYEKGDNRIDSAYTIFYLGINFGALLGMLVCPWLGDVKDSQGIRDLSAFKWGFLAAGIAMAIGTISFYIFKNKYLLDPNGKGIGERPEFGKNDLIEESEKANISQLSIFFTSILSILLIMVFHFLCKGEKSNIIQDWVYPVIYSFGISLAVLILSDKTLTKIEKDRIIVMYVIAFFVIFFWAAFEQAGSSLTFIADKQTDLNVMGINLPPSSIQNFNSFFIILFALPFSWLWGKLQSVKLEPISTTKQAIGLALLTIGYFIIALRVKDLGDEKISIVWFGIMYLFHTLGELCLSPIGLSIVSKLAPKRFSSLLMGVWFLANAAGYALAGTLGALLPPIELTEGMNWPSFMGFEIHNLYEFFLLFVILCGTAAVSMFILSETVLKKMMHGVK